MTSNKFYMELANVDAKEPETELLLALLESAIRERDVRFLNGFGLEFVCHALNLDIDHIRRLIKKRMKSIS